MASPAIYVAIGGLRKQLTARTPPSAVRDDRWVPPPKLQTQRNCLRRPPMPMWVSKQEDIMTHRPEMILWLSDARGQYIPRDFANSFSDRAKHVKGVSDDD